MRKLFSILSLILILTGCATMRPRLAQTDTIRIINEVVKDSIVTLPADSSVIKAWFECDSLNHVIMTALETTSGNKLKQDATFVNSILTVNAKIDSLQVYLKWKERHAETQITKTVERIVSKKPGWLLWLSGVGGGAIVILIILIILKFK